MRKFCGNFAEISQKLRFIAKGRVRKFCGKLRQFRRNLQNIFCNDPFPIDPIGELLIFVGRKKSCKIPAEFQQDFPARNQENLADELLQTRREETKPGIFFRDVYLCNLFS